MASDHPEIVYATYTGGEPVVYVGEGADRRGYPRGSTVEVGAPDAQAIRDSGLEFTVEPVPAHLIGTAEENHPGDPTAVLAHNERLAAYEGA